MCKDYIVVHSEIKFIYLLLGRSERYIADPPKNTTTNFKMIFVMFRLVYTRMYIQYTHTIYTHMLACLSTVEARKLEHDRPPTGTQERRSTNMNDPTSMS